MMNGYYFTFRSVTKAQQAQMLLNRKGISSVLQRTPGFLAVKGCGYCLRVGEASASAAVRQLRQSGMERCYLRTESGFEEADCDLL